MTAKPLAMCVGMGVALLASVSLGRRHQRVWQTMQRLTSARGLVTSATTEPGAARLLQCAQQLQLAGAESLSGKTITVVQVSKWQPPVSDYAGRGRLSCACIRDAQLNILASNLATRNHFPYVVDSSLNWDNRKMALLRQLEELDADVVCLEELSDYWTCVECVNLQDAGGGMLPTHVWWFLQLLQAGARRPRLRQRVRQAAVDPRVQLVGREETRRLRHLLQVRACFVITRLVCVVHD